MLAKARAFVISKKLPEADEGHSAFEYARAIFTLLVACVDPESREDAPEPFFDSAEQILHNERLHRDNLLALFESQQMWQDEVSKQPLTWSDEEFDRLIGACEGDDAFPFVNLRPGKRWAFVRFLVSRLATYQALKLLSTTASGIEIEPDSKPLETSEPVPA